MSGTIPLLDLSGLLVDDESNITEETFASFGKRLYEVLSTSGFAYLANHRIPQVKIEAAVETMERFFSLPGKEKKNLSYSLHYAYHPLYSLRSDLKHSDFCEGFRMTGRAFDGAGTQWPTISNFRSTSFELAESLKTVMLLLLRALGSGMKLKDKEYFRKAHSLANKEGNVTTLYYLSYPPVVTNDVLSDGTTRIGEHSDSSCLTLLLQDDNGGLQVETQPGIFIDVPPIPGTIVLNVGDILQKWSGGRLRSTVHRVLLPNDPEKRNNSRRSIVYFGVPNDDILMEPLEFNDGIKYDEEVTEKTTTIAQYTKKKFEDFYPEKL